MTRHQQIALTLRMLADPDFGAVGITQPERDDLIEAARILDTIHVATEIEADHDR